MNRCKIKSFVFFLLCFFLLEKNLLANSVNDSTKRKIGLVLKTDLIIPGIEIYNKKAGFTITAEKLLSKRWSIQFTLIEGINKKTTIYTIGRRWNNEMQYALIPELKFYVSKKKKCFGYYLGAFGMYFSLHNKYITYDPQQTFTLEYSSTSLGGGIMNGYQFYYQNNFTLDLLAGAAYMKSIRFNSIQGDDYLRSYYSRSYFSPRLAINIGYKF